jgi:hypothetical protein
MPKTAIKYMHPDVGEMWIQRGSQAEALYTEKRFAELNKHLAVLRAQCYRR